MSVLSHRNAARSSLFCSSLFRSRWMALCVGRKNEGGNEMQVSRITSMGACVSVCAVSNSKSKHTFTQLECCDGRVHTQREERVCAITSTTDHRGCSSWKPCGRCGSGRVTIRQKSAGLCASRSMLQCVSVVGVCGSETNIVIITAEGSWRAITARMKPSLRCCDLIACQSQ
jgi:hypothetical protein